ncbi:DUF6777 domain-containing protein [Actinomadura oligospora]|uniref:DUF6777 domain-containing protein n=1 Tax=Actinomadura oligospora TaxID=111804 RepID=UPI000687820E|nr:DUF6777 domain-containing protein [Actinomadura oligospora]
MTEIHFRRRGRAFSAAFAASAVALSGVAGCSDPGTAIARMTVGDPGPDPYAPRAGTDRRLTSARAGGPDPGGARPGDAPGLYGGTRRTSRCDAERLVTFLREHPDRAAAWASVQHIKPSAIAAFVAQLTPVHLRSDTLVTNHGFRAGRATGSPAVLEAGMGVLINEYGVPVVKCNCGNPLTPPDRKLSLHASRYTGPSWPDFHAGKVTRIQPGRAPAEGFVLSDPNGRGSFIRPRGTQGNVDGPRVPEPPVATFTPRPGSPRPRSVQKSPRSTFSTESHFSPQPAPAPPTRPSPDLPTPGLPAPGTPSGHGQPSPPKTGEPPSGPPPGGGPGSDPTGPDSPLPTGGETPPGPSHATATGPTARTEPAQQTESPTADARLPSSPSGNADPGGRVRP